MSEIAIEPIEKYGLSKKDKPKALFSRVGVIGCGTKGQAVTLMISRSGIEVIFLELSQEKIDEALWEMEKELDSMIDHWGMTQSEKRSILSRISGTVSYSNLNGCDLVIDAILSSKREQAVAIRKEIFKRVESVVDPKTIIATNSTTTVITELAAELVHKDRCVSLHFSTTAPYATLVEVVRGLHTSEESYQRVLAFTKMIGKIPIPVEESPGLISVRLFVALISEACDMYMEGVSSIEDIDSTMRMGFGLALGPFEMADKVGLDRTFQWMENLYNEFGDIKYKAPPMVKRLVRANQLGRKTRRGFYAYDINGNKIKNNSTL